MTAGRLVYGVCSVSYTHLVGQSNETSPREKSEANTRPACLIDDRKEISARWRHLVAVCSDACVSISEVADILRVFEGDIQSFASGQPDSSGLICSPEDCDLEDMLELSEMTGICVNCLLYTSRCV